MASERVRSPGEEMQPRPAVVVATGAGGLGATRSLARRGVPVIGVAFNPMGKDLLRYSRFPVRTLVVPGKTYEDRERHLKAVLDSIEEDHPVLLWDADRLTEYVARNRDALASKFKFCVPPLELVQALNDKALE